MTTAAVRYIVDDADEAVAFYCEHLGFEVDMQPTPEFAALRHGALRLFLNQPGVGGGGTLGTEGPGSGPKPGGWNRIQLLVDDIEAVMERLTEAGVTVRAGVVEGRGGWHALIEDPSGNLVEISERKDR